MISHRDVDVSVVIQGLAANDDARLAVESVRQHLPEAEIIVSTWEGEDTSHLGTADQIIYSKDPGSFPMIAATSAGGPVAHNVNRQVVSTNAGIEVANRPLLLKIRSDMVLTGANGFLAAFGQFRQFDESIRHVGERIIGNAAGSTNPDVLGFCFHPGDFLFFGRREDVADYFDLPLYQSPRTVVEVDAAATQRGSERQYLRKRNEKAFTNWLSEFDPETYLFRSFLLKHGAPLEKFETTLDFSQKWSALSQKYIINQFLMLDDCQLGIRCLKYPEVDQSKFRISIDFRSWSKLYQSQFDVPESELQLLDKLALKASSQPALARRVKQLQMKTMHGMHGKKWARWELQLWSTALAPFQKYLTSGAGDRREEFAQIHLQARRFLKKYKRVM